MDPGLQPNQTVPGRMCCFYAVATFTGVVPHLLLGGREELCQLLGPTPASRLQCSPVLPGSKLPICTFATALTSPNESS